MLIDTNETFDDIIFSDQLSIPNGHLSKSRPTCCILVIVNVTSVVGFEPVTDGVAGYLMSISIP
jgi:hypothetical protein